MNKAIEPNQVYNVKEAAELLAVNSQTMIGYCREGKITCRKIGAWKILGQALLDFIGNKQNPEQIDSKPDSGL